MQEKLEKDRLCEKNSSIFFCVFAELGHPYTSYTAERKSFRSSCSPGGGGTKVVYISSSLLQLAVGSRDISQAGKEITVCKADQIKKRQFPRTILSCYFLNLLSFANSYFFLKGQIISECPYEIIVSPKIPTKKFLRFLP